MSNSTFHKSENRLINLGCLSNENLMLYVIVRKTNKLPRFDNHFTEYGRNYQQWIQHLRYSGYEFKMLRDGFIIDIPHPLSPFFYHYVSEKKKNQSSSENLYHLFLHTLKANTTLKPLDNC